MDQDRREQLISALIAKGATKPCARCEFQHFEIVAEANIVIQAEGAILPTVVVACTHCGFISQYALGILGIPPEI
ncbi:hypothetical protein [Limnoglobus roseus]|uniref:Uncharacterized protein n=1 Tax=Limnoglobus roseus TaxID=2598579 RepID=A0A5C1AFQ9_9BACT|nr:hypothetical protein [Limnoglobus roseus]QEL18091.1 hypothetical protein PX52LOC_05105 [Limnoglobus roseus]